jgi:hypothetical protein
VDAIDEDGYRMFQAQVITRGTHAAYGYVLILQTHIDLDTGGEIGNILETPETLFVK